MSRLFAVFAMSAGLVVAGCGGGGDSSSGASGSAETTALGSTGDLPGPDVEIPEGSPPTELVIKDVRKGSGAVAKNGDVVSIQYVGRRWSGAGYSDSWTYSQVPSFELGGPPGSQRLIPGLDRGVRGMKVGGRREVIVPPKLIYFPSEEQHRPAAFRPSETLVFLVDLLAVHG
jgi:FKBP-type peptidyl-prolyl cis-trans isomerase